MYSGNMHTVMIGSSVVALGLLRRRLTATSSCESEAKDPKNSTRLITVRGTAHERGVQLHALMGHNAAELAASRRALYSAEGLAMWDALATNSAAAWRKHAPVAWAELEGRVAAGANLRDLLMLGTDFEIQMAAWRDPNRLFADDSAKNNTSANCEAGYKEGTVSNDTVSNSSRDPISGDKLAWGRCTAFAVTGRRGQAGLCGQNVDEDASGWRDGRCDAVVRLVNSGQDEDLDDGTKNQARLANAPTCAVYTHPGVPGYCGMNSAGLCVLDLYIDEDQLEGADDDDDDDGEGSGSDEKDAGIQVYKVQHDPRRGESPHAVPLPQASHGLPIDVTIRELLAHRDLKEAVAWLEALPRAAPSTYLFLQGDVVCCVEASARRGVSSVTTLRGPGATLTHSNHALYDDRLAAKPVDEAAALPSISGSSGEGSVATTPHAPTADAASDNTDNANSASGDIGLQGSDDDNDNSCSGEGGCSSEARLQTIRKSIQQAESPPVRSASTPCIALKAKSATSTKKPTFSVRAAQDILEACPAAHAEYAPTIARVVLEPERGLIHVNFIQEKGWHSFPVADRASRSK